MICIFFSQVNYPRTLTLNRLLTPSGGCQCESDHTTVAGRRARRRSRWEEGLRERRQELQQNCEFVCFLGICYTLITLENYYSLFILFHKLFCTVCFLTIHFSVTQRCQQNSEQSPHVPSAWLGHRFCPQRRTTTATETCRSWCNTQKSPAEEKEGRKKWMVRGERPKSRVVPQLLPYMSTFWGFKMIARGR